MHWKVSFTAETEKFLPMLSPQFTEHSLPQALYTCYQDVHTTFAEREVRSWKLQMRHIKNHQGMEQHWQSKNKLFQWVERVELFVWIGSDESGILKPHVL